jgi:O-antigen/teichoic acid export membrane protein
LVNPSFKSRVVKSFFWSFVDKLGQQSLHFIISVLIARKLSPGDYGLIGMLSIFLSIATTFIDSGLGEAIIQKKDPDLRDFSTIFIFNIGCGTLLYLLIFLCSPLIAKFYNEPQLATITKVLALNLILVSFSLVQLTVLKKLIDYRRIAQINLIGTAFSGFIGIYLAYNGFGVWALIIQILASNTLKTLLLWQIVKWRPTLIFDKFKFRILFSFSSKLLISWLINQVFTNLYSVVIGKLYNANLLGFYTQGRRFAEIPNDSINTIFQNVTYPLLSEVNNTKTNASLKQIYRKLIRIVFSINLPIMITLIIVSNPLIITLLTYKWAQSAEFFKLFCFIGIVFPLTAIYLNIAKVKGNTKLYLRLVIFKKTLFLLALILTFTYGIKVIIIGQIIATYIGFLIEMKYTGDLIGYSIKEQIKDILSTVWIGIVIGIATYTPSIFIDEYFSLLLIQLTIAVISYIMLNWLFKTELFTELMIFYKIKSKS